jgi:hypothetical protein
MTHGDIAKLETENLRLKGALVNVIKALDPRALQSPVVQAALEDVGVAVKDWVTPNV